MGLDEETYREIHSDFPLALVNEWLPLVHQEHATFHYVSGSGADANARMMWAKEKALAEDELSKLAVGTNLRVISYRPAFIKPTETELNLGHQVLFAVFAPIGYAVSAESIGHAMLEASARGPEFQSGAVLENREIAGFGKAYEDRRGVQ